MLGKIFWLIYNAEAVTEEDKTFLQKKGPMITNVIAYGCIVGGFLGWFLADPKLFEWAIGWGGKKAIAFVTGKSGAFFWKFIANMLWNFLYSTIATVLICSKVCLCACLCRVSEGGGKEGLQGSLGSRRGERETEEGERRERERDRRGRETERET